MKWRTIKMAVLLALAYAAQRSIALYLASVDPIARATSGHLAEVGCLVLALLVLRFYLVVVVPAQLASLAVAWFVRPREAR